MAPGRAAMQCGRSNSIDHEQSRPEAGDETIIDGAGALYLHKAESST